MLYQYPSLSDIFRILGTWIKGKNKSNSLELQNWYLTHMIFIYLYTIEKICVFLKISIQYGCMLMPKLKLYMLDM